MGIKSPIFLCMLNNIPRFPPLFLSCQCSNNGLCQHPWIKLQNRYNLGWGRWRLFNNGGSSFRLQLRISTTPRLCLIITPLANSLSSRCPIIIPSWWHPIHITKAFSIFHQLTAKSQFKGTLNKALILKLSHLVSHSPRWTFETNHLTNHLL